MTAEPHNTFTRSLDFICIIAAFAAASGFAVLLSTIGLFTWPDTPARAFLGWPPDYAILLIASLVSWSAVSAYFGIHKANYIESFSNTYWRLGRTLLVWAGVTGASTFLLKLQTVSRQFTLSFVTIAGTLIILRHFIDTSLSRSGPRRIGRKAVILGVHRETQWLRGVLSAKAEWSNQIETTELERLPEITEQCVSHQFAADAEFFILPTGQNMAIIERCTLRLLKQKRVVHIVPAILDTALFRHSLGDLDGVPLITLEPGRLSGVEAPLKRALDGMLAAAFLLLLAPLMAFIAAVVTLTSSGPIFFSQERLGRNGHRFTIYKFRTMRSDAEALLKGSPELYAKYTMNNFKLPDGEDFRITRIGRFLRATSLDELPQLFNVLRGDMSLVGPRPIVPAEIAKYGEYGPLLLSVKPGMTGRWQINGRSNVVDYSHRVKLDMEYIRDQSLRGDVEIIVKTISAVTRMEGAH